jgi:hypothetical protein
LSPLESLINRFVDDVSRLIREAKVEDLLGLIAEGPRPIPPLVEADPVDDPIDLDDVDAHRRAAPTVARAGRRRPVPATTVEEITDPASLLAIGPETATVSVAPPTLPALLADTADEPPPSSAPPPSSTEESRVLVRLRGNETVARASNAGIVIRRRKA